MVVSETSGCAVSRQHRRTAENASVVRAGLAEEEFFAWATAQGAIGLDQVKIAWLNKGGVFVRSLVAAKEVTVPILLPRSLLMFDASERLLALQLAEQRRCDDSFWAPWIKILPSEEVLRDYHVAYASPKLLQLCEALPVIQRLRGWQDVLRRHWEEDGCGESFSDFKWASTILQTRVFRPPPCFCFMPMADMMNTSLTPNMEVYDRLETDLPGEFYGLIPMDGQKISSGTELTQAYCPVDNSERLFRCGFLLDGNPVPVKALPEANVVLEKLQGAGSSQLIGSLRALVFEHMQEATQQSEASRDGNR